MLSQNRLAQKRAKREARRKKLRKLHKSELDRLNRGDLSVVGEVRARKLKNRRDHHMGRRLLEEAE